MRLDPQPTPGTTDPMHAENARPEPRIDQAELTRLALRHEPHASASPPTYRMAICVKCGRRMIRMWHLWLHEGGFKKEVHLCRRCARRHR